MKGLCCKCRRTGVAPLAARPAGGGCAPRQATPPVSCRGRPRRHARAHAAAPGTGAAGEAPAPHLHTGCMLPSQLPLCTRTQDGQAYSARVVGYNHGGLIMSLAGYEHAFLPLSGLVPRRAQGRDLGIEWTPEVWVPRTLAAHCPLPGTWPGSAGGGQHLVVCGRVRVFGRAWPSKQGSAPTQLPPSTRLCFNGPPRKTVCTVHLVLVRRQSRRTCWGRSWRWLSPVCWRGRIRCAHARAASASQLLWGLFSSPMCAGPLLRMLARASCFVPHAT